MRELLSILPKPSRYTGAEEGAARKDERRLSLRVALAFPDLYEVGMSYLGQKILYSLLNENSSWQAERVFAPCMEAGALLRARQIPLATLESDTPLRDLDLIGFSVTHELCYTNVLYMLDLAGIPLRAAERADGHWPIIVAGGGCTLSAEPLAPFMDIMFLGEGEEMLPEFLRLLEAGKAAGRSRAEILEAACRIPGLYVPEFFAGSGSRLPPRPKRADYTRVTRRVVADMDAAYYPARQVIPFGAVHNRLALEIGRGCTRGCRFCQAGMIYRPARERSLLRLDELLQKSLADTGYDDVSFLSLSSGDFSGLKTLFHSALGRCRAEQVSVSLPSLRVGSIDDSIMQGMAGIRRTGATLAPEAGSQRLRDVINKGVTEEELILHVQKLFEYGWQQVKLYFMIGLPTETDDDLRAVIELCRKARDAAGPGIKRLQITAAVSPFVPKPHTPFQWEGQTSLAEIRRRIGVLLEAVKGERRIKLRWHEPETSFLEGVFSRGDRRLAGVVERAYHKGAIFTDWIEHFKLEPWLEALAEEGLSAEEFTAALPLEAPLPWEHLQSGVSRAFLLKERERALQERITDDCRYAACRACGICTDKGLPSLLESPPGQPGVEYRNRLNFPQRDQAAHEAPLDEYGRVKVREAFAPEKGKAPQRNAALGYKACCLRLWYRKEEGAVYLSQLELQSIFERAMRRAALPLAFSQGFHPMPLLSFARALPVGVASQAEWLTVHLREKRRAPDVLATLHDFLPAGLELTQVEALPPGARVADAEFEHFALEWRGADERRPLFEAALAALRRAPSLPWSRENKKGRNIDYDLRVYFLDFAPDPANLAAGRVRFTLDWSNGYLSPLLLIRTALALAQNLNAEAFGMEELFLSKLVEEKKGQ